LDELDLRLLETIKQDSSISVPKLAKKLAKSPGLLYSRIKRLTKQGIISRYTIEVNEEALGLRLSALVGLKVDAKQIEQVKQRLATFEEVREVMEVTGAYDVFVRVKTSDLNALRSFLLEKVAPIEGVKGSETFVVLSSSSRSPSYHALALPAKAAAGKGS
jgi:DNA-binding Lrp family transcriptional regulator